jgi:hypothetical protein
MVIAGFLAFEAHESLLFLVCSFRSFERINLLSFLNFRFNVRGGRAVAGHPLAFRIRIDLAILTRFKFKNFTAITAFVDYHNTAAAKEAAAFFAHKSALHSILNCLTKHFCKNPLI